MTRSRSVFPPPHCKGTTDKGRANQCTEDGAPRGEILSMVKNDGGSTLGFASFLNRIEMLGNCSSYHCYWKVLFAYAAKPCVQFLLFFHQRCECWLGVLHKYTKDLLVINLVPVFLCELDGERITFYEQLVQGSSRGWYRWIQDQL